jgi:GNAT superfamily N-acetyltransferase
METISIVEYDDQQHHHQVADLWQGTFGYDAPHNEAHLVIDKKLAADDGLFYVALQGEQVIGTVMAGYDGHRGWIYSLAVIPELQKKGIGTRLVHRAEQALTEIGCMKINLQITEGNEAVEQFYLVNGYASEKRISMGKRIPENIK